MLHDDPSDLDAYLRLAMAIVREEETEQQRLYKQATKGLNRKIWDGKILEGPTW